MKGSERLSKILVDVADAIRIKKGTNELIKPENFSTEIASIETSSGGSNAPVSKGDITFYDYNGTILHSYTKNEFLALTEMPTLPEREGLICQGWNYTLEDAKTYVEEYGVLHIGAMYITDDGKTRLYIRIAAKGRMDVPLYFSQTVANGAVIDWGDGSETQTLSGKSYVNTTHKYTEIGDYVITLDPVDGCTLGLGRNASSYSVMGSNSSAGRGYCNMLQRIEVGRGVTSIGDYTFNRCCSLTSIVIPNSVISIGTYAFINCCSLASIVIPNSVTSIGAYAFQTCYSLTSIVIPNSVTSIGNYTFSRGYSLTSIVIPNSVTSIGNNAFQSCNSLTSIVIPNSVTSIGAYAFQSCNSLASIVIPNSVTSIGTYAFEYCYSLSSIVISNSVTSIGNNTFGNGDSLVSIVIPNSVTSIGAYAFCCCYTLISVMIPNSVTSIGTYAFQTCYSVAFYDFSTNTAVPTLSNTNAFSGIAYDCKIIVPDSLYDEWISATNWSSHASRIIKKSDWDASQA